MLITIKPNPTDVHIHPLLVNQVLDLENPITEEIGDTKGSLPPPEWLRSGSILVVRLGNQNILADLKPGMVQ
jgi:hypothetical protein